MHPDIERLIKAQQRARNAGELAESASRAFLEEVRRIPLSDEVIAWAMTATENDAVDFAQAAEWVRYRIEREGERAHGNTIGS